MKKFVYLAIGLIIIIAIYLYASPYLALNSIKKAAQAGDADTLSEYIDFPSVKQGLKDQINAQIMKEVTKEDTDGFEALGAMLATAMINPIVDGIVTPEGVAMMVQGQKPDLDGDVVQQTTDEQSDETKLDYKTNYVTYKSFKVSLSDPDDGNAVDIIMRRDGLSWKVSRINLPLDFSDSTDSSQVDTEEFIQDTFDFDSDEYAYQ